MLKHHVDYVRGYAKNLVPVIPHDATLTTIHNEIIAEPLQARADARLREMKAVMGEAPPWAYGLPLKAEGAVMARYGK